MIGNTKFMYDGRKVGVFDFSDKQKMIEIVDKNGLTQQTLMDADLVIELGKLIALSTTPAPK